MTLMDAQIRIEGWRRYWNEERLHSSLGYQTSREFAAQWEATGCKVHQNAMSLVSVEPEDGADQGNSAVTDAGLAYVKGLTSLRVLGLVEAGITDKGLEHVKGMKWLDTLNLHSTRVTKQGIAALKKALPRLFIIE